MLPPVQSPNPSSHHHLAPLVLNIPEWERQLYLSPHADNDFIIESLHNGVDIGLTTSHFSHRPCSNLLSAKGKENVSKILQDMVRETNMGRRAGPFRSLPFYNLQCSPIGTVPKKRSNKLRVIHHLSYPRDDSNSSVNESIEDIECEYLLFDEVLTQIAKLGKACLLSKFDIHEAFRLIRVRVDQQYCLGMRFQEFYFYERCLPFGLKSAPGLFEKFSSAINRFLTKAGIPHILHYVDDFLCLSLPMSGESDFSTATKMFNSLGVPIAAEKVVKLQSKCEFLGLEIDCANMKLTLPLDKLESYRNDLLLWRNRQSCTRSQLQSLVGKLVHASRAIPYSRTFYQRLLNLLRNYKNSSCNNSARGTIIIDEEARLDISWWYRFISEWNGIGFIPPTLENYIPQSQHQLFTDACNTGMGGFFKGHQYTFHQWSPNELLAAQRTLRISMPYLEMLSLVHCLNIWQNQLKQQALILHCDCQPVVYAINSGKSDDPGIQSLLRQLIYIISSKNIFLSVVHIAGHTNRHADLLSRSFTAQEFLQLPEFNPLTGFNQTLQFIPIQSLPVINW